VGQKDYVHHELIAPTNIFYNVHKMATHLCTQRINVDRQIMCDGLNITEQLQQ